MLLQVSQDTAQFTVWYQYIPYMGVVSRGTGMVQENLTHGEQFSPQVIIFFSQKVSADQKKVDCKFEPGEIVEI